MLGTYLLGEFSITGVSLLKGTWFLQGLLKTHFHNTTTVDGTWHRSFSRLNLASTTSSIENDKKILESSTKESKSQTCVTDGDHLYICKKGAVTEYLPAGHRV